MSALYIGVVTTADGIPTTVSVSANSSTSDVAGAVVGTILIFLCICGTVITVVVVCLCCATKQRRTQGTGTNASSNSPAPVPSAEYPALSPTSTDEQDPAPSYLNDTHNDLPPTYSSLLVTPYPNDQGPPPPTSQYHYYAGTGPSAPSAPLGPQ